MSTNTLTRQLKDLGACPEAVEWAKEYKSLAEAWAVCERSDWMLWLCEKMLGKPGWPNRKQIVAVVCDCAELVLPIYEKKYPDDDRARKCIEVTRAWVAGEATIEEVCKARDAAYDAAYAAYAVDGVYVAADGAYAAADAAAAAAGAATLREFTHHHQCADFCRKRLTIPEELKVAKAYQPVVET